MDEAIRSRGDDTWRGIEGPDGARAREFSPRSAEPGEPAEYLVTGGGA